MVELDDFKPSFTPAVAAEFIGTFLVQFLASACAANAADNGLAAAALGTGFAFAMVMYSISHISGGHLNPAVTVGHLITGGEDLKLKEGLSYIIAQFFGAVCGAFLAKSCLPIEALVHPFVTMGSLSDKHGEQVFMMEFICTFLVVLVFYATVVDKNRSVADNAAPIAVGLCYAIGIFAEGPYTGGAMSPARTFGPAVAFGTLEHVWYYVLATFLGGIAAAYFYVYVIGLHEKDEHTRDTQSGPMAAKYV
ncbi:hypothetical protein GUITHDRAFT_150148 [Guillardia theta CCMP2712]|uniref:Aquaporin n=1 Tax=Guillardia theta (strain CCMP2712) TaxID=905079 RepID=L1K0D3_GUITC|nr:hypothetical protein GUITHDRAFT_150148 [Guillardia theta CCMP2712]EKX54087.1 hypothetical protein GUITHDRAFT_150148 [Guillardia theta CCMP2712]|mmetsp:Transcript_15740/g.52681  ORF Transcript_15740/g.52681 Transcript_15740/m.52681 type:complete len:250 (-) Transcript_15740:72-821(-)|eukprot:XP_005841067.1 hypothetical protein GUITHDRAFT_150148 [Guillardia theta CCMP2712]